MKRFSFFLIVLQVLVLLLACAPKPTPAPTPPTVPAPTPPTVPAPTQTPVKPIEWKFSTWFPEIHPTYKNVCLRFADELEKRTGGRIKVTVYASSALGIDKDHYDMARTGVAEIAWFAPGHKPGFFPLSTISTLPFAAFTSEQGSKALWALYKKGYLDKEYSDVKVIALNTTTSYHIFFVNKNPQNVDDLKGLKIISAGGYMTPQFEAVGISPMFVTAGDRYLAVQRGVVDGVASPWGVVRSYKYQEVTKYAMEVGLGVVPSGMLMNKSAYAALPKDIQQIIDNLRDDVVEWMWKNYDALDDDEKARGRQEGLQIYALPTVAREKWVQLTKHIWTEWADEMEAKGLPGKSTYNDYLSILKDLGIKLEF